MLNNSRTLTDSKGSYSWRSRIESVVLSSLVIILFLMPSGSDLSGHLGADDTYPDSAPPDDKRHEFPPENRPDPPASDLDQPEVPDLLKGHDYVYRVDYVLDGDSIRLKNGKELRMIGVDAPEKDQRFADAARDAVRTMIPQGSIIGVDLDRKWWDRYGRLLGYVYTLHREQNKSKRHVFINEMLVTKGFARTFLHRRNKTFIDQLIKAQRNAIRKERRLFGQIQESADQYYRIEEHYRFHRPDCRYIRDIPDKYRTRYEMKREALRSGCSPASCCDP